MKLEPRLRHRKHQHRRTPAQLGRTVQYGTRQVKYDTGAERGSRGVSGVRRGPDFDFAIVSPPDQQREERSGEADSNHQSREPAGRAARGPRGHGRHRLGLHAVPRALLERLGAPMRRTARPAGPTAAPSWETSAGRWSGSKAKSSPRR